MSRLEGNQPNTTLIAALVVIVLVAAFAAVEYLGIINLIPGF